MTTSSSFCLLGTLRVVTTLLLTYTISPCNSFGVFLGPTSNNISNKGGIFGVQAASASSSCLSATLESTTTTTTTKSSSSSSSSSIRKDKELGRHKFDGSAYDKPIVLVGCSGAGKELSKLASSWIAFKNNGGGGRAVVTCGNDERGTWTVSADTIGTRTTRDDVILLDFDASAFQNNDQAADSTSTNINKLTKQLTTLLQELYEQDYLIVYVNVHPEHSKMNKDAILRKESLESTDFIPHSHFEIVLKDEGLDTTTKMADYLLSQAKAETDSSTTSTADDITTNSSSKEEEILLKSLDPLTKLRCSGHKTELLERLSAEQGEGWDRVEWEFRRLLAHATSSSDDNLIDTKNTFFLSLSFGDVMEAKPFMEKMCADVDSLEFRADLLDCADSKNGGNFDRFEIMYQQQLLRHMCRPYAARAPALPEYQNNIVMDNAMPIVYTVRTAHQAGIWPDQTEKDIQNMFELLYLGLRTGVEVLDVESAWDKDKTNQLLKKARDNYAPTSILGSHHVVHKAVTMDEAIDIYHQCTLDGRAEGAKVVLSMGKNKDGEEVKDTQALESAKKANLDVPFISLMLGPDGQYSRIINDGFTPVTHEALPFVAAPGQLSANEIMAARLIMGEIKPTKFGILGHQISYSVSPAMHNTAFSVTNLPHTYELVDMEKVSDIVESKDSLWNAPNFGGCSVTIPHKQDIIPYLDELTPAAREIGAVNTVLVQQATTDDNEGTTSRYLVGDNTDWKGIYVPLKRRLSSARSNDFALILGGGGTARAAAYAANQLGLTCLYYNRTPQKAHDLQKTFGGIVISSLVDDTDGDDKSLGSILKSEDKKQLSVIVSTLPASVEFELPLWLTRRDTTNQKIVVLDVNYKPYWTALSKQLSTMADKFDIVRGSEMLWEQGIGQFEAWTKRTAPYGVMKRVVLENCLPKEEEEEP